jgi:hypothetical protein
MGETSPGDHVKMPSYSQDHDFYQAGVKGLEAYLLSNELFWPLSGRNNLPRLTIGGMLLAGKRLGARIAKPDDQFEVAGLEQQLQVIRSRWRAAWERKAAREFQSRFGLWQNYLGEYQHSPDLHAEEYAHEVQERAVLHLLRSELSSPLAEFTGLEDLDKLLKRYLRPGVFVWESDLASSFSQSEYWFLYGKLRSS